MRLFKRKKTQVSSEATAQKIADVITRKQAKLATYLNEKVKRCSAGCIRLWLIGFCLVFGGYCLYLIMGTFN